MSDSAYVLFYRRRDVAVPMDLSSTSAEEEEERGGDGAGSGSGQEVAGKSTGSEGLGESSSGWRATNGPSQVKPDDDDDL